MMRVLLLLLLSYSVVGQTADATLAQRAVEAERSGNFPAAIKLFRQLIENGSDSPELRTNLGIAYYQSGDPRSALVELRNALSKSPEAPAANLFCGLSLLKLEQPKEALRYLKTAGLGRPDDVTILGAMAQAEVAANQIGPANAAYRRLTSLDKQDAQAWYGLGITDRLLAEAKAKAAKQSSDPGTAERNRKESQVLMDDFERSIRTATQLDPGSVRASMIFGESLRIAERYEDAVREYKHATERAPELAAAWAGLAAAQSAAGDDPSALKSATQAQRLDPKDPETNTLIAAIYVRMGELAKAEPFTRAALQVNPSLSSAHLVLAKVYLAASQPQKALPELESAAKDDVDGTTHYLLATTLRQLGRPADAAAARQRYEQLHKTHMASVERPN